MRLKQILSAFLSIVFLAGCGKEELQNLSVSSNEVLINNVNESGTSLSTAGDSEILVTDDMSEDGSNEDNKTLDDRVALVSEENRIWFDEEGTVRYYGDFSKMNAMERQAVVVPEEILSVMTTEELFDMVFEWANGITEPYIYDFPSYYIDYIYYWFNGMPELLKRDDLGELLISNYHSMEFTLPSDSDTEEQLRERHRMAMIEILLAFDSTYDDLDDSERLEIVNELYLKSENRITRFDYSGFFLLLQQKDLEENTGYQIYNSDENAAQDYYNKEWNWCNFINENCSEDIKEMLMNQFF